MPNPALARMLPFGILLGVLELTCSPARASDIYSFGGYVGAGVGQASVKDDSIGFDEHHVGWKVFLGVRPISLFGAEIEYVDFGHPSAIGIGPTTIFADAKANGVAAFSVAYLPLPFVDLFAKAGVSRIKTSVNGADTATCINGVSGCNLFAYDNTQTGFAWGLGALISVSHIGIRAEYEKFGGNHGNPDFVSVAATWKF